jgi:hypothetical protein
MTTNEHIKAIIDSIDATITVTTITSLGSNKYKLFTTNTKWATFGKLLNTYKILEVRNNVYIIVSSTDVLNTTTTYSLDAPYYYFGTFLDTNAELIKKKQSNDKLPFIYLHLNAPEVYASEMDLVDFESDCAIYFMVDADPKNWLTGDHYTNAIVPMKSLVRQFIISLSNYAKANAAYNLTYTENDYVNFGQVREMGVVNKIFTDNISGVELLMRIPFNKCLTCCN